MWKTMEKNQLSITTVDIQQIKVLVAKRSSQKQLTIDKQIRATG